jgi:hypothetical protein
MAVDERNIYYNTIFIQIQILLCMLWNSPNIIRQIKSRRMRWAGHVARMGEERIVYRVMIGKP